jgi:uncharacterized protein YjbJ (UPF0337 family)
VPLRLFLYVLRTARALSGAPAGEPSRTANVVSPITNTNKREENNVDKDRIEGAGKQVKGAIKDAAGKITGDAKLQSEGKADKAEGKIQNAVGGLKDKIRENT